MIAKKPEMAKNRVAIYIRVSTLHQIDKDSLPMQRKDLIAYSQLILNTDDYVIFEDAGYSGKNTDRPQFQEMMAQVRQGLFSHILVWKIDRISRNLLDFSTMYSELKELGVTFVSKSEQFDTSTAMGEAMLKIILVFAELERNMTSERVQATMLSRASNGLWNGGRVPYGYDYDSSSKVFSINQAESEQVRLIHDEYEKRGSLTELSRFLNDSGYRTRAGNLYSPVNLSQILRSVFYCGDYRYNVLKEGNRSKVRDESEWVTISDHHPAIISREQKERVLAILNANRKLYQDRSVKATKHTHIFSGMLVCSHCGHVFTSTIANSTKAWQYSVYHCPTHKKSSATCPAKSTSDPPVGEFIFNYILNMLNAQNGFDSIDNPAQLEAALLSGSTFSGIDHIDTEGLQELFDILASGNVHGAVFGKSATRMVNNMPKELKSLKSEKIKLERAIDRLTSLYLYSDDAISEAEFTIRKSQLADQLDEINEQIGLINSDSWELSVTDQQFLERASSFVVTQKLSGRNYVSFKRLATSVDSSVLQSFVRSIIDNITITDGKVTQVVFRNGLCQTFIQKK